MDESPSISARPAVAPMGHVLQASLRNATDAQRRLYAHSRDCAHNFEQVVKAMVKRLEEDQWPELRELLDFHSVSDSELASAIESFVMYTNGVLGPPTEGMDDVMIKAGWLDRSPEAQVAVLATIGGIMMGMFFIAKRQIANDKFPFFSDEVELVAASARATRLMAMPRWRRWLVVRWHNFKQWLVRKE